MFPSPAPDVCWLYLVRHGATTHNLSQPPILQGRTVDLSLSDVGRSQAEATAKFLQWAELGAVYSSDLARAKETAEMIAHPHGRSVHLCPELREVDVGRWESLSWGEIERTEPEAYRQFVDDPAQHGYAGGENLTQVLERVRPVFDEILNSHIGRSVVVVGHNVVNRTWLAHTLCMPLSRAGRMLQDNCCINVIRYRHGEAVVWTLNSTFHLRA
jgi:broad specificity phosphatase PhoE